MSRKSKAAFRVEHRPTERRSETRETMILRVGILADRERTTFCLVKNISPTGAQIKPYGRVADGCEITLRVGDEDPLPGRVAWVTDALAGIEFAETQNPAALLRATQKLPPTSRRSSPRINAAAWVLLRTGGRTYAGELRDISTTGAKIRTLKTVPLGPSVMLTIPDLPAMRTYVRWKDETDLGLLFETPLPIQLIAEWLSERVHVSG